MTNTVLVYGAFSVMGAAATFLLMLVGAMFALREFRLAEAVAVGSCRGRIVRSGVLTGVVVLAASFLSTMLLQSGEGSISEALPLVVALVIAVTGCTYACSIILATGFRNAPLLGGAAIGFTIAVTQLAVMVGHHPAAPYAWNLDAIMFAIAIAVILSVIALRLIARRPFVRSFELGCVVLAANVVVAHIVALGAVASI